MKNILTLLGAIGVFFGYWFSRKTTKADIASGDESLSFASFLLWCILDLISAIAISIKKGNPLLTILFVIGSGYISFYLYKNNKRTWNPVDSFIVLLIIICCIIWYQSGEIMAIISSTIAVLLGVYLN